MSEKRDKNERDYNESDSSDDDLMLNVCCTYSDTSCESDFDEDEDPPIRKKTKKNVESDREESGDDGLHAADSDCDDEDGDWIDVSDQTQKIDSVTFSVSPQKTGIQIPESITKPVEFFRLFFTDDLIDSIVNETNDYARAKIQHKHLTKASIWKSWTDIHREEFLAFLGVVLNMGTMPLPYLQEYWSTNHNSKIPFYSKIFTRARFQQIFWMLHLTKRSPDDKHLEARIQKADDFLQYINDRFSDYFIPGRDICINESVIKSKGKISFMTYNSNKPTKWGIKLFVLSDSETGYAYSILPYYGSVTTKSLAKLKLPISSRIPLELYKKISQKIPNADGYHMYTDRYYTSVPLANELLKLKCYLTGVIKTSRRNLPENIKKSRFPPGKKVLAYRKNKILVLGWKDMSNMTMLSTCGDSELTNIRSKKRGDIMANIQKPKIVVNYKKKMRGVSLTDEYAASYCFLRRSLKWWRKLFFWGMETCVINSYILYRAAHMGKRERFMSKIKFVKLLVDQLVGGFQQGTSYEKLTYSQNEEDRLKNKLHIVLKGTKRCCVVCSNLSIPGGRHETHFFCDTCIQKPHMHLGECFERYHTLKDYKKQ